jgi:hypothetical protein
MPLNFKTTKLRVGDWVEVRSREEILLTLDEEGRLDGMPFMPEMFAFCGKQMQVYKRAHKTCDTVFPVRGRRVQQAVHLDTRCDGSAHGGCQAGCLLFWKEAWLKPLGRKASRVHIDSRTVPSTMNHSPTHCTGCSESTVWERSSTVSVQAEGPVYSCQATLLPWATTDLEWWDVRQYLEDYSSGNVSLWQLFCGGAYFFYYWLMQAGIGLGRPLRWFYDTFYRFWGGSPFPRRQGIIPAGDRTPVTSLNLQPGELVRIKPYQEILTTLDTSNRNRGLFFDAEEVPYCGGTYRVQKRVTKIINERTGAMLEMKTPSVILDSVICEGRYSECRLYCPRSIYSLWRETWLERVQEQTPETNAIEDNQLTAPL